MTAHLARIFHSRENREPRTMSPIETHPLSGTRRRGRTPEEITAQQKEDAAHAKRKRRFVPLGATHEDGGVIHAPSVPAPAQPSPPGTPGTAVAPAQPVAVAIPDNRSDVQRYLDGIAPAGIAGRLIKFTKEGVFATAADGEPAPEAAERIPPSDETLDGRHQFGD